MKRFYLSLMIGTTLTAAFVLAPPAFAQTNLFVNPGFEDGGGSYDGWTTFGDGVQLSAASGDNIVRTGVEASKVFGEFVGCPPGAAGTDVGGYFQAFTPTSGKEYEFSGFGYISSEDSIPGATTCDGNRMIAKIVFFDAAVGGNEMSSNEVIVGDWQTPLDEWLPFTVKAPAPDGALRVEALILFLQPACDLGAVYVDDLSFVELTPSSKPGNLIVNPSFDLGLSSWTFFGNVFPESRSFGIYTAIGSAKLFGPFSDPEAASVIQQVFPAAPGSSWELNVYAMTTCVEDPVTETNDNVGIARIAFLDGAGIEIGGAETTIVDNTSPLGTWREYTVHALNAPSGTVEVKAALIFVQPTDPLLGGAMFVDDVWFGESSLVDAPTTLTPRGFQLYQNVPNPFQPSTRIDFALERADVVDITIYDVLGRRIQTLVSGTLEAGPHAVTWDGTAANGTAVAPGVYRYVLKTSTGQSSRSMMLLK